MKSANAVTNIDRIINRMGRRRNVRHKNWAAPKDWAAPGLSWLRPNRRKMNQTSPPYNQKPTAKKPKEHSRTLYTAAALALVVGGYGGYKVVQQKEPKAEVTSKIIYDSLGIW